MNANTHILNHELNWVQVGAMKEQSSLIRDAFREQQAERVLLQLGTELYKFNDVPFLTNREGALSRWWQPYRPLGHDPGWLQKVQLAKFLKVSIIEYGRVTSAVKENWNSLEYLLVIALRVPVYAWFGGYAKMARLDEGQTSKRNQSSKDEKRGGGGWTTIDKSMTGAPSLPGGATQLYIPNLEPHHVAVWRIEDLRNAVQP